MKKDEEGFFYPVVDYSLCINCSECIKVCPVINKSKTSDKAIAFSCINNNEEIRLASSSGGIFTLLAESIISQKGIVFGAGFNEKFELKHNYVENKEALKKFRGAKYLQSEIGNNYKKAKKFLDSGRSVLFAGTPCQIAGLNSYLKKKYSNLLSVDVICHGVPSSFLWGKYLEYREGKSKSLAKTIKFRQKNAGWRKYSVSFLFKNNMIYSSNFSEDLYMKAYLKNICLRPSCYKCRFKSLYRESDITLADFWGVQKILPEFYDDKGTSLVFVNSEKGKQIFNRVKKDMRYRKVDIEEVIKYNLAAVESVKCHPKRNLFMLNMKKMSFEKLVKKYCSDLVFMRVKNILKKIIKSVSFKNN